MGGRYFIILGNEEEESLGAKISRISDATRVDVRSIEGKVNILGEKLNEILNKLNDLEDRLKKLEEFLSD